MITLSSVAATRPAVGARAYGATKAAIEALTRTAALELAPDVRVTRLAPGILDGGLGTALITDARQWERYRRRIPLRRASGLDEAARAAVFLAGPDSSYVTGSVLGVCGGFA